MRVKTAQRSGLEHAKTKMALEAVKVAVGMKQHMAVPDAERRDQRVYRFAHRHALSPEGAVILRGGKRDLAPRHRAEFERLEMPPRPVEVEIGSESLQNLDKNQVADQKALRSKQALKQLSFGRRLAVEIIHPDGGIDESHEGASAVAPHRVEIAFPFELAAKAPEPLLALERDEQLQGVLDGLPLGFGARGAHRSFHQSVVNHNIGPHGYHLMCIVGYRDTHRKLDG